MAIDWKVTPLIPKHFRVTTEGTKRSKGKCEFCHRVRNIGPYIILPNHEGPGGVGIVLSSVCSRRCARAVAFREYAVARLEGKT